MNIPKPDKIANGGEDAFFASKSLLIVADGVGGWAEQGVDSGLYSRSLVRNLKDLYEQNTRLLKQNPK